MVEAGHDVTIFFYNPNIHPRKEYEIRKEENKRYAHTLGVPYIYLDGGVVGGAHARDYGHTCRVTWEWRTCILAQVPAPSSLDSCVTQAWT